MKAHKKPTGDLTDMSYPGIFEICLDFFRLETLIKKPLVNRPTYNYGIIRRKASTNTWVEMTEFFHSLPDEGENYPEFCRDLNDAGFKIEEDFDKLREANVIYPNAVGCSAFYLDQDLLDKNFLEENTTFAENNKATHKIYEEKEPIVTITEIS